MCLLHKLGFSLNYPKSRLVTISATSIYRSPSGHHKCKSLSTSSKSAGHSGHDLYVPAWGKGSGQEGPSTSGSHGLLHTFHPGCKKTHEIYSMVPQQVALHKGEMNVWMSIHWKVASVLTWWGVQDTLPPVTVGTGASTIGWSAHLGELEIRGSRGMPYVCICIYTYMFIYV